MVGTRNLPDYEKSPDHCTRPAMIEGTSESDVPEFPARVTVTRYDY